MRFKLQIWKYRNTCVSHLSICILDKDTLLYADGQINTEKS